MLMWFQRVALALYLTVSSASLCLSADDSLQWAWSKVDAESAGDGFWPQFRGPTGDGHASANANPPIRWSEKENVRWRLEIPGKAWSSPVAWGNTIWLTTASEDGLTMSAMALNRATGAILWNKVIFTNKETQKDFHAFNSYGSPTPVLDGKHLYVSFGAYGTAALNRDNGDIVWQRRDLPCNHFRGPGSSPILFRNLLIFHMDGFDYQYVVALNKQTGDTIWKVDRDVDYETEDGDVKKAFSTPTLIEVNVAGSDKKQIQMISTTSKAVLAYDPTNGKELWRVRYAEFSSTGRPVFDGQTIFISTGFSKAKMLAIASGGAGDITKTHVKWESSRAIGSKPSPMLVGKLVCTIDDRGVLSALDPVTGETAWQSRLGGDFSGSPILAHDRIYCFDEQGKGHVYSADGKELAVNTLDAGSLSSPMAIGNDLIVRTRTALYCISEAK